MYVCNTGLDCSECPGCETQLEYDEVGELLLLEEVMRNYWKTMGEKAETECKQGGGDR